MVFTKRLSIKTVGNGDMLEVTRLAASAIEESSCTAGLASVFVVGSTASITTIEYEPGLAGDFPAMLERIAPSDAHYEHEARWNDDNGHSHVRASLIGPSVCVPFNDGVLELGTWQQIVLVDFDTRPRE